MSEKSLIIVESPSKIKSISKFVGENFDVISCVGHFKDLPRKELAVDVENNFDGIIINPAAFTHTSIAILDALRSLSKPKIEIHLSNIYNREEYRKKSITSEAVNGIICGFSENSYILAIEAINNLIYK